MSEKLSSKIFAIDTTGSEAIKQGYYKTYKQLKADEILGQRSAIPPVDSRKRSHARTTDGVLEPSSKRHKKNWVSKKEVQRLKQFIQGKAQLLASDRLAQDETRALDLWADDLSALHTQDQFSYLPEVKPKVAPPTLRRAPIPLTDNGKPVPAIRQPNAGSSYNPDFTDYKSLLTAEAQKEIESELRRIEEQNAEAERAARVAAATARDDIGGGPTDDESAWEGIETEPDHDENLSKKRPERKTQAQRNKIKRRKQAEAVALHEKKTVDRLKQAADIEALKAQYQSRRLIQNPTEYPAIEDRSSSDSGSDTGLRRRKLGTIPIPPKTLEIVLPEELQDSLRRLRPEGNLLNDRFRHLLVNGKLEARKRVVQPRKKRVKLTEKWTYKDFEVKV